MIENDEQLDQTRMAITRLESALKMLKRDVLPVNPARYALMAEPAVDQIQALRNQIDEYTGVTSAVSQEADLWMKLEGPEISLGDAPTSVVTAMLDLLRRGVQTVAEFLQRGAVGARPTADMKHACDLRIVAWLPGSVQVGLRLPEIAGEAQQASGLHEGASQALAMYLQAASWVGSNEGPDVLEMAIPEAEQRRLVLNQVSRIIPRPRGATVRVELSGRAVQRPITLQRSAQQRVRDAISHATQEDLVTVEGLLREIDLDGLSFIVRDPESVGRETRCEIRSDSDDLLGIAKEALDHAVVVRGTRKTDSTRRKVHPLQVLEIEVLDPSDDEILDSH
jgi:hypothetical protein